MKLIIIISILKLWALSFIHKDRPYLTSERTQILAGIIRQELSARNGLAEIIQFKDP